MKENSYDIYQLKNEEKNRYIQFMGTDYLKKKGIAVQSENYDLVYHAPLGDKETLDSIYEKFNLRHPEDFRGHSLSVSDVVVFHKEGKRYCLTYVGQLWLCRSAGVSDGTGKSTASDDG